MAGEAKMSESKDRFLWWWADGHRSNKLFVTEDERVGITVGAVSVILPVETWFDLGLQSLTLPPKPSFWQRIVRWWKR